MGIIEADHVIGKGDHALPGKAYAAGGDAAVFGVGQTSFFPVAVRIENAGEGPGATAPRTIKISRQVKARKRLNIHLLDAVTVALDFAENMRSERSLVRHRPQTATHEQVFAD